MPTSTFGADKPTMTLGGDGSGVVTASLHYLDGSVVPLQPIGLDPHQVTEALRVIPQAAQVLLTQLTAHGGAAQPDDIAGLVALVQYILTTPAASSGSGVTTVTTAPPLLF